MAVVVEQTTPFSNSTLELHSSIRWNTLLPLIRPSIKSVKTTKGQEILIDLAHAQSPNVRIVALSNLGSFSSKILDDSHVTAIVTKTSGAGLLTAEDLPHVLSTAGVDPGPGIVVVRIGKTREITVHSPAVLEVEVQGELEQDHVLHLLGTATGACRASIHQTAALMRVFVKGASTAHSRFHTEKAEGNPVVLHVEGAQGFEHARHAVERDLKFVMQRRNAAEKDIMLEGEEEVYSVHYSDINGLSRLENYVIGSEVAAYLESQNIPYRLSHSTVLDSKESARGFSISICAVPARDLDQQQKPLRHQPISSQSDAALKQNLTPANSKIAFKDAEVRRRIEAGCKAVIAAEPTITEYDTIVGDGDCGYTLRDGAQKVLSFIEKRDLSHLPQAVSDLVSELEVNMGGTSGALYCIFLTALASSLATEESISAALKGALVQLTKYTRARVGDRTMMDTLIPYIETLSESGGNVKVALEKAKTGVDGTAKMEAKLGRSTYLDESATRGVPDPGAYGLMVLLDGMSLD